MYFCYEVKLLRLLNGMNKCVVGCLCLLLVICIAAFIAGVAGAEWRYLDVTGRSEVEGLWRKCVKLEANESIWSCDWVMGDYSALPVFQRACQIIMASSGLFSIIGIILFFCWLCTRSRDVVIASIIFFVLAGVAGLSGVTWYAVEGYNYASTPQPPIRLVPGWAFFASLASSAMFVVGSALIGTLYIQSSNRCDPG